MSADAECGQDSGHRNLHRRGQTKPRLPFHTGRQAGLVLLRQAGLAAPCHPGPTTDVRLLPPLPPLLLPPLAAGTMLPQMGQRASKSSVQW